MKIRALKISEMVLIFASRNIVCSCFLPYTWGKKEALVPA